MTQAEIAIAIREIMHPDKTQYWFAVEFLKVNYKRWNSIEIGIRRISPKMQEIIKNKCPGISYEFMITGNPQHLTGRFADGYAHWAFEKAKA